MVQPSIGQNYLPLCIPYDTRNEAGKINLRNHHSKWILAYRTFKNSAFLIIYRMIENGLYFQQGSLRVYAIECTHGWNVEY